MLQQTHTLYSSINFFTILNKDFKTLPEAFYMCTKSLQRPSNKIIKYIQMFCFRKYSFYFSIKKETLGRKKTKINFIRILLYSLQEF